MNNLIKLKVLQPSALILWKFSLISVSIAINLLSLPATAQDKDLIPEAMEEIAPVSQLRDPNPMAQITSVSQLRDVSPGDWAYEALRSLVERYGCLVGYPDQTFRGNRAATRWEFAAGLNACLNSIERLIQENRAIPKEDIETLKQLAQEFEAELTTLGGRIDNLENRVAFVEDHQFSTTTKLNGLVFWNLTGAYGGGDIKVETSNLDAPSVIRPAGRDPATGKPLVQVAEDDPEFTFSDLVWITLNTSFTGKDSLVTQLAAGNGDSPANYFASAGTYNTFGVPFTDQTAGVQGDDNNVIIRELFYSFPATDNLQIVIGPRVNWYRYFDNNAFTFFFNGASSYNTIGSTLSNAVDRGSGAVVLWEINDQLRLNVAYLGENSEFLPAPPFNTSSDPEEGLFGGTNTSTVELTYSPSTSFNIRLMYNYTHLIDFNGLIGGVTGEPIQNGLADAGPGAGLDINPNDGGLKDSFAHTVGVNFDWTITPNFGIFARYTYATITLQPIDRTVNVQSIQAGFGFLDLGKEGALGVFSFLIPFDVLEGDRYLVSGNGDGGTQYDLEATYYYPLTPNIAIVPTFYLIVHPNNFDSNPPIYVVNLRTQFSF